MKIKFIWSILLAVTVAFTSCEQSEVSPDTNSVETSLSELALLAVSSSSRTTTSDSTATDSTGGFGRKCSLSEVKTRSLPATITTYITSNYAGASIQKVGKASEGGYIVYIKKTDATYAALSFDASGTFVSESTPATSVEVASLPDAVTSYISTTYAGSTVKKAVVASDGRYLVAVEKADGNIVGLAFTAEGAFVQEVSMKSKFGCHSSSTTSSTPSN